MNNYISDEIYYYDMIIDLRFDGIDVLEEDRQEYFVNLIKECNNRKSISSYISGVILIQQITEMQVDNILNLCAIYKFMSNFPLIQPLKTIRNINFNKKVLSLKEINFFDEEIDILGKERDSVLFEDVVNRIIPQLNLIGDTRNKLLHNIVSLDENAMFEMYRTCCNYYEQCYNDLLSISDFLLETIRFCRESFTDNLDLFYDLINTYIEKSDIDTLVAVVPKEYMDFQDFRNKKDGNIFVKIMRNSFGQGISDEFMNYLYDFIYNEY